MGVFKLLNRPGREVLISRTKGANGFRIVEIRHYPPSSSHHPSVSDRVESKFRHGLGLSVGFHPRSQNQCLPWSCTLHGKNKKRATR
jgi:hypothetical protein